MEKVILFSLLFATLFIPLGTAGRRSARVGLREALGFFFAFCVLYGYLLVFVVPELKAK